MDEFFRRSRLTGKSYDYFKTVQIRNINQASAYIENNVFPVDIIPSRDEKTGKRILLFYFDRAETRDIFDKWCNYELD